MAGPSEISLLGIVHTQYARKIWKRSFSVSATRSTFLSNRPWKQSFPKTLFKPEEFEDASCTEGISKTMTSRKQWEILPRVFLKLNPKWLVPGLVIVAVLLWGSMHEASS